MRKYKAERNYRATNYGRFFRMQLCLRKNESLTLPGIRCLCISRPKEPAYRRRHRCTDTRDLGQANEEKNLT